MNVMLQVLIEYWCFM